MEALTETSLVGRPSWLFDWHSDGLVYAWFPSEGNYNLDDVTTAYILGVPCTPNLAPRDYDEWQLLPGNVFPDNPNTISINRIRPITYHGAIEYRTIESRAWRFPPAYRRVITDANPSLATAIQPLAQEGRQVGTSQPQKRARTTTELAYGLRSKTGSQASQLHNQLTEGKEAHKETAEVEGADSLPTPATQPPMEQVCARFRNFCEARIVDYLYHAQVVRIFDLASRQAAHRLLSYQE
nr:putative CP [Rhodiola cryptic virus 2]